MGSGPQARPSVPAATTSVCPLQNYELVLHEGTYKVVQRGPGGDLPYKVRYMGIYLTVETHSGLVLSWDRKTSLFIRLQQDYKVRMGGLWTPSGRVRAPTPRSGSQGAVWQLTLH